MQLPVYVPTQSAEERKEELALRNQFKGRTPEEIVAAQRTAPQLFPRGRGSAQPDSPGTERRSYQVLHDQIADEIAERQRFIDNMRALGKAGQHELRIKNEIADRMSDLARVERLQRRSKYILADLHDRGSLLLHLGMSGRMLIVSSRLAVTEW